MACFGPEDCVSVDLGNARTRCFDACIHIVGTMKEQGQLGPRGKVADEY
jgi:hypothetical protein